MGYLQPIASHLRYFLAARKGRSLGCWLSDFVARYLVVLDRWAGRQRIHGVRPALVETYVSDQDKRTCYRPAS